MSTRKWKLNILAVAGFIALMLGANVALSAPPWGIACGDGRVDTILDDFDSLWKFCCTADPSIPNPTLRTVPGCNGNAMAVDYDLRNVAPPGSPNAGQSWIALQRFFPSNMNLTNYTHIRLAMRGSNINSHDSIDVKLKDDANHLCFTRLVSMTDMPVWRAIYIDLREITGNCTIDLARIVGLEIAINRCAGCEAFDNPSVEEPPEEHVGTLYLDEFAAVNLKLDAGADKRLKEAEFETVTPNPTVRANAANALRAQISSSGPGKDLIRAWFPEKDPNFDSYAVAETLLVFVVAAGRDQCDRIRVAGQCQHRLADPISSAEGPGERSLRTCITHEGYGWTPRKTCFNMPIPPAPQPGSGVRRHRLGCVRLAIHAEQLHTGGHGGTIRRQPP